MTLLYNDTLVDYGELFYEFGVAYDLIKDGIKLSLPVGLHEDIGSKVMTKIANELLEKTCFIHLHDSRLARMNSRVSVH